MNKQTSDLFDMYDPFAIAVVASNTNIHSNPDFLLVHSPEYYFVMHYKYLNKTFSRFSSISIEDTFSHIQYMADSLMKNLIFRELDIPVTAWTLLEPMGTLGRQYKKLFRYVFPETTPAVSMFLECYDKCKAFVWKHSNETNQVIFNLESSIKHLSRLYELYLSISSENSKRVLATVLKQYTQDIPDYRDTTGMQTVTESNHTYYFRQIELIADTSALEDVSFDWDLSKVNFTLGESVQRSNINGIVVDLGISRDVNHPLVRYQEALLNVVNHLQTADHIYLGYLCEQVLNAINIHYRELPLLGIFSEEPTTIALSTLINNSEEFSHEKIRRHKIALVNALVILESYQTFPVNTVCNALAVIIEVLATEVEHFDVFREYMEEEDYISFIKGLDRFKDKDLENYRMNSTEEVDVDTNTYTSEYFEKHFVERYNKPAICISMFPSARAIKWFNSL